MSKSRIKRISAHLAEKPRDEVAAIIDRIVDQNEALMELLQKGDSLLPAQKLALIERAFPKPKRILPLPLEEMARAMNERNNGD